MAAVADYAARITSAHRDKPRFLATVSASVQPIVDAFNVASALSSLFDVDSATGVQLDAIGLWVGVSRYVALSVNEYFSFDTAGVGWDQGVWWQVGDATAQVTTLDDANYRLLIRAKIGANNWDGTLPTAKAILAALVASDGATVSVVEGDMSVTWSFSSGVSAVTQAILTGGYLPLKPVGVSVSYIFAS